MKELQAVKTNNGGKIPALRSKIEKNEEQIKNTQKTITKHNITPNMKLHATLTGRIKKWQAENVAWQEEINGIVGIIDLAIQEETDINNNLKENELQRQQANIKTNITRLNGELIHFRNAVKKWCK